MPQVTNFPAPFNSIHSNILIFIQYKPTKCTIL